MDGIRPFIQELCLNIIYSWLVLESRLTIYAISLNVLENYAIDRHHHNQGVKANIIRVGLHLYYVSPHMLHYFYEYSCKKKCTL